MFIPDDLFFLLDLALKNLFEKTLVIFRLLLMVSRVRYDKIFSIS